MKRVYLRFYHTNVLKQATKTNAALLNFPVFPRVDLAPQMSAARRDRQFTGSRWKWHTHRLVFDGGAGDAQVQLPVLLDAGVDEGLDRALVLEQQERISCKRAATRYKHAGRSWRDETLRPNRFQLTFGWKVGLAFRLVGPVHKQVTKAAETGSDFICNQSKSASAVSRLVLTAQAECMLVPGLNSLNHNLFLDVQEKTKRCWTDVRRITDSS